MEQRKKLGILGGMGAEATQVFFKMIVERTKADKDQEHLDILIYNHASIPDRTVALLEGKEEELWSVLEQDILMLKQMGCDYFAIPCNAAHHFMDRYHRVMAGGFINMIEETAKYAKNQGVQRAAILATDGTLRHNRYYDLFAAYGMEAVYPEPKMQKNVMNFIYNQIKVGQKGNKQDFDEIVDSMRRMGCDRIILACTEFSVYSDTQQLDDYYIDAMEILTSRCIELCGGVLLRRTNV